MAGQHVFRAAAEPVVPALSGPALDAWRLAQGVEVALQEAAGRFALGRDVGAFLADLAEAQRVLRVAAGTLQRADALRLPASLPRAVMFEG